MATNCTPATPDTFTQSDYDAVRDGTAAPRVGMRATFTLWTDSKPCTVVAVSKSGKTITLRVDSHRITRKPEMVPGGFAAVVTRRPEYEISENPDGHTFKVTARQMKTSTYCREARTFVDGTKTVYKRVGTKTKERGATAVFGPWLYHYDYGF